MRDRTLEWHVASFDQAITPAEREATEHVELLGGRSLGLSQAFALDVDAAPGHGDEVFSLIRDSPLSPDTYLDAFFDSGTERQQPLGGPPPD